MGNIILKAILYGLALLCYYIEVGLAMVLDQLEDMFDVFVGLDKVKYNGESAFLIDIFLKDEIIFTVYKGMALIGVALLFGFTIIVVIKKIFDYTGEKQKQSYGEILIQTFKSGLLMFLMTGLVMAATTACTVLIGSIEDLFNSAGELANPQTIVFDEKDNANMFRVVDTVANYSMNPSSDTKYNLNICFNEIATDMQTLESSGMFRYSYEGAEDSWQYYLRLIYLSGDIHSGIAVDEYNDSVSIALQEMMHQIKYNPNFKPVAKYTRATGTATNSGDIGRTLMLSCTLEAAKNSKYNGSGASIYDGVRAPYYNASRNIYNRKDCEKSFDVNFDHWHHDVCIFVLIMTIISFFKILFNAMARIFNIILLYLVAPLFLSVAPLDGGGKMKQWTTAFVIQSTSIIGVYISIRLMLLFIPIIMNGNLQLFSGSTMNYLAKDLFVIGVVLTADKAGGMITGILADNAGYQSIMAGDIGGGILGKAVGLGKAALGLAAGIGKGLGKGAADLTGLTAVGKKLSDKKKAIQQHGLVGAARRGFKTDEQLGDDARAKNDEAKEKKMDERFDKLGEKLDKGGSTFSQPDVSIASSANVPPDGGGSGGGGGGGGDVASPVPQASIPEPPPLPFNAPPQ